MTAHTWRALLAATLCIALVTACGRKDEPPAKSPPPTSAARPGGTLNLYNWNNYIAPETVARFEKEFGAKIVQTYFSDNEEMLAKLAAGATGYDIIVPTSNALEVLIKKGDVQPLDHTKLPNLANMKPELMDTAFDPGNKYSVPYAYSTTVIGFNDRRMKEAGVEARGFEALFDPKVACKVKGHITVLDSPDEVFSAAFIYLGIDPNTTSSDD
jgi:spermidine/putrescine transport system substrate-binding protein